MADDPKTQLRTARPVGPVRGAVPLWARARSPAERPVRAAWPVGGRWCHWEHEPRHIELVASGVALNEERVKVLAHSPTGLPRDLAVLAHELAVPGSTTELGVCAPQPGRTAERRPRWRASPAGSPDRWWEAEVGTSGVDLTAGGPMHGIWCVIDRSRQKCCIACAMRAGVRRSRYRALWLRSAGTRRESHAEPAASNQTDRYDWDRRTETQRCTAGPSAVRSQPVPQLRSPEPAKP